ncbi:pyruvate, water dikinase regulatory protein [Hutsoniella sourekii]|uniref:pyruvate, water dikinase regulatory protein n=1 Tax=Hutsoniella sourekii TaxID=87650 RepID=UPI0004832288|nr:pyruvate, water dikinase regulatory protein [Hutsoniella sourekii]
MKEQKFYIISDSVGGTGNRVTNAAIAQFPELDHSELKTFPFVNNPEDLLVALMGAKEADAIVVATLVDPELNEKAIQFAQENNIYLINPMEDLMEKITEKLNIQPIGESGRRHSLNDEEKEKLEAIEFTMKYDDGQDREGILGADILILGISRTSKTPTSMFLAHQGFKVMNLPLIPESELPAEVYQISPKRIFGLLAEADYIQSIRSERLRFLGLPTTARYAQLDRIQEEIDYSKTVYEDLGCTIIEVANISIEEVAEKIADRFMEQMRKAD